MAAPEPAQVLLEILAKLAIPRVSIIHILTDACDSRSEEAHLKDAGDVGQVRCQPDQSQLFHELFSLNGTVVRKVIVSQTVAELINQCRTESMCVGESHLPCITSGIILAQGRKRPVVKSDRRVSQCETPENCIFVRKMMVASHGEVRTGVPIPGDLFTKVLKVEYRRIADVGQRIEAILKFLGDRVDPIHRDAVSWKLRAGE